MSREVLKQARKDKNMTQQAMADYLNVKIGYYKMIEAGTRTGNVELWDKMEDLLRIHQRKLRISSSPSSERNK